MVRGGMPVSVSLTSIPTGDLHDACQLVKKVILSVDMANQV